MKPIPFGCKKFCRVDTLAARWDCSKDHVYELVSKGVLKTWHPEGLATRKGMLIDVQSVLTCEEEGMLQASDAMKS